MRRNKIIIFIVLLFILNNTLMGCTYGSYITIKSKENNTRTSMAMSYEKFNGHKSRTIALEDGETCEISVDITSVSGKLNLSITDKEKNSYYERKDMPTSTFKISLDKPGEYIITMEGENHKGSYESVFEYSK